MVGEHLLLLSQYPWAIKFYPPPFSCLLSELPKMMGWGVEGGGKWDKRTSVVGIYYFLWEQNPHFFMRTTCLPISDHIVLAWPCLPLQGLHVPHAWPSRDRRERWESPAAGLSSFKVSVAYNANSYANIVPLVDMLAWKWSQTKKL